MSNSYLPQRESELVTWTAHFASYAIEHAAEVGLDPAEAAAYGATQAAYAEAYAAAQNPVTRSPSNIEDKNQKKAALIATTRRLVGVVQAFPGTTDVMRSAMGITVRDYDPTPVPVPDTAPTVEVVSVDAWTVNLRLHNGESTSRAKPAGVKGATVFSYVGETPPVSVDAWKFEGSFTKTATPVTFPDTLAPGTKVWLTAFWFNPTSQSGPAATPVSTRINYGGMNMPQAA